jgi:ribonuclease P protein component
MNERLEPCERIRRKKDFIGLYKQGHRYRGRYFNLVYLPSSAGISRVAVVASRKVGGAVERNRIKRWLREAFRMNKGLIEEPTDILVIARPDIQRAERTEVFTAYTAAVGKIFEKRQPAS